VTLRRTWALVVILASLACLPSTARATQSVKLTAAFTPDKLNTPTTISFGFQISAHGQVPAPLTGIDLRYPVDIGLATSGVGLATCLPRLLDAFGPKGCPPNSLMGRGNAVAEFAFGPELVKETASVTLLAAPPQEDHIDVFVYALAGTPVNTEIIFSALLLPESPPFGGRLHFDIPLIPSVPEAPDVAIVSMHTTLGPLGLTYYEHAHGKTVAYHPTGILLPSSCPRGGFPIVATFEFLDGSRTNARTTVPCPALGG
jgi:hypothetical protein